MHPTGRTTTLLVVLALLAACQPATTAPSTSAPTPAAAPAAAAATPAHAGLPHVTDFAQGMAQAKAEGKAVLVDAWAPWCHTCLSMQNYVLNDPSLASLSTRVVLVELDTDKDENAGFLQSYKVSVWPTFFVIDPATAKAAGIWPGSASAKEFRGFVEDGLAGIEAEHAVGGDPHSTPRLMMAAKAAQASGDYASAAQAYEKAVAGADASWPRRSEALMGWVFSLEHAKKADDCVRIGRAHLAEVQGAAVPADYAATLLSCTGAAKPGPDTTAARADAVARIRAITQRPPPEATADDRADALNILSGALADAGDAAGARKAQEGRLAVLQGAAKGIQDPLLAQTFDYARAQALVALDRGDEAVAMLKTREKELPDSYEPPARLASALDKMNRLPEAVVAYDRAIAKSYGPRQLLYLRQKADAQARMGDAAGQVATLKAEVAGYQALTGGHANPEGLADAKKRLAEAEHKRGA